MASYLFFDMEPFSSFLGASQMANSEEHQIANSEEHPACNNSAWSNIFWRPHLHNVLSFAQA